VEAKLHAASPSVVRWLPGHCAPDPRSQEAASLDFGTLVQG
jgi:hypothetical protein